MQELIQSVLRKSGISMRIADAVRKLLVLATVAIGLQAAPALAQTVYFHNDAAGSPIAATDASGNLLWKESYRPYGERMLKPAAANTQWFHGKQLDPDTGLEDFGARNYDPVLGRFLSIDPVDFHDKNIHTFNRYAYGANNPLRYKDPDGRLFVGILGGPAGVEAGLIVGGGYKPTSMGPSSPPPLEAQLQGGNANPGYAPAAPDLFAPIRGFVAVVQGIFDLITYSVSDGPGTKGASGSLTTPSGNVYNGNSTGSSASGGTPRAPMNPLVEQALRDVVNPSRSHGKCCEIDAMNKALNAGDDVRGARMGPVQLNESGRILPACSTCSEVKQTLGVE